MGAIDEEEEPQVWVGHLGIKVLGVSRARHPVDF